MTFGAVILFVASTEKLNPVALVKENLSLPPLNLTPPKKDWMGVLSYYGLMALLTYISLFYTGLFIKNLL